MKKDRSNKVFGVLGVIANLGLVKVAPESSVRRLVRALNSSDEDTSTAAYMALVKLGPDYASLVLKSAPEPSAGVIQVLGDMGDESVIPELERYTNDEKLGTLARESIDTIRDVNPAS